MKKKSKLEKGVLTTKDIDKIFELLKEFYPTKAAVNIEGGVNIPNVN